MTFKHLKFSESSTMRAFEKMATQKGLVKANAVQKIAENPLDLTPSDNLLENVLKLSSGLRSQGFNKYANELENKYLVFKEAQSLYETFKETGEDLVDQAHPKGSHKLENGDHTVLTIVDQKKKIEEIVNKKPSGKFASNDEIIDAVKTIFADFGITMPPASGDKIVISEPFNGGTYANAAFISSGLNPPAGKLGRAAIKLNELKKLATHDRVPVENKKAIDSYIQFIINILNAYMEAVGAAGKFAKAKEKERLAADPNPKLAFIKLDEVKPFFAKGKVQNLGLSNVASFDEILSKMSGHLNTIAAKFETGLAPGFEFDEEDMKALGEKAKGLIADAAGELK